MKINKVGCRVSEDVCIVHDEPLICRHGCSEAKDHKCPDIMTKPIAQSPKPHTTHYACKEVMDKYGGEAMCCHCTKHRCKVAQSPKPWMAAEIEKWGIEFDEKVNELRRDPGSEEPYAFGYKYKIGGLIVTATDWGNIKDFIRQLLNKERQAVIDLITAECDATPKCVNSKCPCSKTLDSILSKLKPQEFHRCPKCGAISSWDGCFCERKRGETNERT